MNTQKRINFGFLLLLLLLTFFSAFGGCVEDEELPEYYTVGVILPFSGDLRDYALHFRMGIDLAVDDANRQGGINGREVKVKYVDNAGNRQKTIEAFENLSKEVPVVIGAVSSGNTIAISELAKENEVVLISPGSTSINLSGCNEYFFRTIASDKYQGRGLANLVSKLHPDINGVGIVYFDSEYGTGLRQLFIKEYTKHGKIVVDEAFVDDQTDFSNITSLLIKHQPEVVVIIGYFEEALYLFRGAEDLGFETAWFGVDGLVTDAAIKEGGSAVEGLIATIPTTHIQSEEFIKRYKESYGNEPDDWMDCYGYDTMSVLVEVMRSQGYESSDIVTGLRKIRHLGVCGPKVFDENGDIPPAFDVLQIKNGRWERIDLGSISSGDHH